MILSESICLYTGQPVSSGAVIYELEDFVGAKFYYLCHSSAPACLR